MYDVHLSEKADKFLEKLDLHIKERIIERLRKLGEQPMPSDAKFIGRDGFGEKIFRYRIGDYRSLYKINDNKNIVLIVKIDKRPRIYDRGYF